MKKSLLLAVAGIAGIALAGQVSAATVSWSLDTPTVGDGILNIVAPGNDGDNLNGGDDGATYIAGDRNPQGQTFTTGSNAGGYLLNSVSFQHVKYTQMSGNGSWMNIHPNTLFNIRIVSVTGSGLSVLSTETATPTFTLTGWGVLGDGEWYTFALNTPQLLAANTVYGFDVDVNNGFMELGGKNSDIYAGGNAYTIGAKDYSAPATNWTGDRAFAANMTAVVPEPGSMLAMFTGLVSLAGFGIRRRK